MKITCDVQQLNNRPKFDEKKKSTATTIGDERKNDRNRNGKKDEFESRMEKIESKRKLCKVNEKKTK